MQKIIWAIAAVFCVQVLFQLAMTAERSDADYAALQTPLHLPVSGYVNTVADEEILDTTMTSGYSSPVEESVVRTVASVRKRPSMITVAAVSRRSTMPALAKPANFQPVVITYDRTGALTEAAAFNRVPKAPVKTDLATSDDKRPLIAKIVSKPYDWLKTVASKLH